MVSSKAGFPDGGRRRGTVAIAVIAVITTGLLLSMQLPVVAQSDEATADEATAAEASAAEASAQMQELAERYAPIMMLKAQDAPCDDDGEPYGPTAVDIVLDNPEVLLRQVGNGDPVVRAAPSASDLFGLGEGFFLDFPGTSLAPGCVYETDFDKYRGDDGAVVYAHIVQQPDVPDRVALQYWFYWYFNDWNNTHESDWEGIQLLFDASTVAEALRTDPISVGYAQHEGGERADWESSKLERDGSRPVVYSSAGSHASYFSSAVYLGRGPSEGFGCDTTDGPSQRVDPSVVVLPSSVDDPDHPLAWLAYDGRWGERQPGPFNGPTGPTSKERWTEPVDWHDDLRDASVVIPAGDGGAAGVIGLFCDVVESGSGALILFTTSPTRVLIALSLLALAARWLIGRTSWGAVPLLPIVRRRRAGQILRSGWRLLRRSPALWLVGLLFIPAAVLVAAVARMLSALPLIGDVLNLVGSASGTGVLFATFLGGVVNLAAFVAVNAMVAAHFADVTAPDQQPSPAIALRTVRARWRDLVSGFLPAYAIVLGLAITVVGIPFAIRQAVRYQFIPHAVMLDGLSGAAARRRSSELVRGRWWHTATMTGVINVSVAAIGIVLSLLALVAFPGLPLWAFSALITAIYAVIAPVTAIMLTLLYGDAVAERERLDDALDEATDDVLDVAGASST